MKFFVLLVTLFFALFLASCGDQPINNIVIGTDGIENTWDKAVSDTRNEYDRTKNRVEDTLFKANMDVLDEEKRTSERVKDTAKKANMDVLDEEKRTSERVKDTAKKANMDVLDEEKRTSERVKDTAKKANDDFNSEKERFKDAVFGTDERQIESNERRIKDLERRMALVEELNRSQDAMLALYLQQMQDGDAKLAKDLFDLRVDLGALSGRVATAESSIQVLEILTTDLSIRLADLEKRVTLDEAALAQEIKDRMAGDSKILADLAEEASIRAHNDFVLGAAIFAEYVARSIQVNKLQTSLGLEIAARIANDKKLSEAIIKENNARQALDEKLTDLIKKEEKARIDGDQKQAKELAAEVNERKKAIAEEALARSTADSALANAQDALTSRVKTLETAVTAPCTLSVVGPVSNVNLQACDSLTIFGVCAGADYRRRLYSADMTLQCLGKKPVTIQEVVFESSPQ